MSGPGLNAQQGDSRDQARKNAEHAVANLQRAFSGRGSSFDWADPEALAANRRGEITSAQRQMLQSAKSGRSLAGCLFWMLGLVVALPAIIGGIATHQIGLVGSGGFILVVLGLIWAMTNQAAMRIDSEVEAKAITQSPGEIIWRNNSYIPVVNGQRLRIASERYGNPFPGPQEFYYLPKTRYLLAASSSSLAPQAALDPALSPDPQAAVSRGEPARLALLQAVTTANTFQTNALVKNRDGAMTARQRWRLIRSLQGEGVTLILQLAIALIFIIAPFVAKTPLADDGTVVRLALSGGGLALLVYTLFHNARLVFAHIADIISGQLAISEVSVDRELRQPEGESDPITYYYQANGIRFKVSKKGYDALIPGLRYRVFYALRAKVLLNIEPIDV